MTVLAWVTGLSVVTALAMGALAFGLGVLVGFLHRTYTNARVPFYAPVIVGLGAVGLAINSANALVLFVSGLGEVVEPVVFTNVESNLLTTLVGGVAAYVGGRVGDVVAPNLRALVGAKHVNTEVNKFVRTVGRFVTVTVPENIQSIDGYDPVTDETRSKLAGLELVFPRGVTVDELRDRIATRLREDYGVGYVDVEVDRDGEIVYLALGRRVAGIGPTLPPRRVALAVTANPAPKASPGDLVQLWELPEADVEADPASDTDPESAVGGGGAPTPDGGADSTGAKPLPQPLVTHGDRWYRPDSNRYEFAVRTPDGGRRYRRTAESAAALIEEFYGDDAAGNDDAAADEDPAPKRVAQAEVRATNGDVATVTVDVNRLSHIDQSKEYRLVTLPSDKKPENEFASLLRAANKTMETVTIESESELVGIPIGALRPNVAAVRPRDGAVETLPPDEQCCEHGDTLYVIGRHDQLRKLSAAAA